MTAVDALVSAKRVTEAVELASSALALPAPPAAAEAAASLRVTLSSLLLLAGRPREALRAAEAVLAEPGLPGAVHDNAELARLRCLMVGDGLARARERAEAVLAGSDRPSGDAALAGALTVLSLVAWREGRVAGAFGLARAAVRRAEHGEVRWHHPRLGLAAMLTAVGEFDVAAEAIRQTQREIELGAATPCAAKPAAFASRLHLAAGRLDDAAVQARVALELCEDLGTPLLVRLARTTLAEVALYRGDHREAARQILRCRSSRPPARSAFESASWVWAEARLATAEGDPTRAAEVLAGVYDSLPARPVLLLEQPAAAAWLVRVALAAGDRELAENVVVCAEHLAVINQGFAAVVAAAAHARGLLDQDAGTLARAADGHRHPWARASASEDAGVVLAGGGDQDAACTRLAQALEAYEQAGAEHDAARVRARLRDLGVRISHTSRAERPVSGWASLTGAERRVAEVVADGLTNAQVAERLFLSRHTVDFHLRQIFRKLGVRSRVKLTRLVLESEAAG